jgi:hypothetical protein
VEAEAVLFLATQVAMVALVVVHQTLLAVLVLHFKEKMVAQVVRALALEAEEQALLAQGQQALTMVERVVMVYL